MKRRSIHIHGLVWLTILLAALLSIIPMPDVLAPFRPAWIPLTVIFWQVAQPSHYGLFFAWVAGLLMDALYGTVFGQCAMGMLFMAIAVNQLHRCLKMHPWWQQSFVVLVVVGLYQLIVSWIGSATGRLDPSLNYLLPSVTSALVWPVLTALFHRLHKRIIVI